ncbi:MAG TPA: EhaD family protein [Methanospirillum sp.]|nr:EhaD family protein [Methanospirillum sp.]
MNEILIYLFGAIAIIGAIYTGVAKDPYQKLISIGLLSGASMPLLMDRGYVDIAIALALILPLSTVFILQLCRKGSP